MSNQQSQTTVARKMEAAEAIAYHAEEFLGQLERRWPEVNDMDDWRDVLLNAISELRML